MKHAPTSLSLYILTAGLLAGTSLVSPTSVRAASTDLQAQTGWAITRVASMAQGSYCTMAQKFNNDTVVTIARNNEGEHSLAFDFQAPKFEAGKATTASVKAGSGSSQTFEVQPSSPQVIVIGLGKDDAFISSVKTSGKLQLDVNGNSYTFNTVKFSEAQDEMSTCMSSMKPQMRDAKNEAKAPIKTAAKAEAQPAPQPERKLSAEALTSAPVEPLPGSTATAVAAVAPAAAASSDNAAALAQENARLKQALNEARRGYENQMTSQQGAIVPELQEKIRSLDMENAKLKTQVAEASGTQNKQELGRLSAELDKTRQDLTAAAEQNKTLQSQLQDAAGEQANAAKAAQSAQLSQREAETLKAENQTLKNQIQIAAKASSAPVAEAAKLQQENTALKADLAEAVKKADAAAAVKPVSVTDPAQAQMIASLRAENERLAKELASPAKPAKGTDSVNATELQKQLSNLQTENATLKNQLASAKNTMTPMPAAAPVSAGEQESLRGQLRDLRSQLEIIEAENNGLKKQLETAQREGEGRELKVAGGSWDLEQATRRYQESQREIRRLGSLLEEDRSKCKQEKKEIEYMLFDPEVAQPAQISMLNNLEDQVAAKDAKIAELETALRSANLQPASGNAQDNIKVVTRPAQRIEQPQKVAAIQSEKLLSAEVMPMRETPVEPGPAQPLKAPVAAYNGGQAQGSVPFPLQSQQQQTASKRTPALVEMAAMPAPVPAPAPVAKVEPAPSAAPVENTRFQSSQDFAGLLNQAGVTIRGAVQPVQKVSSANYQAFSWQTDSLYGSAEQRPMASQTAFEPAVQQYIDRAKSRCKGEFAAVPAQMSGSIPAEGYEIACVSGQSGSSASVLFTYKDGIMTTVAHEGRAEAMDIAMDARDRVAARIISN